MHGVLQNATRLLADFRGGGVMLVLFHEGLPAICDRTWLAALERWVVFLKVACDRA